jgi:hypothetical protein
MGGPLGRGWVAAVRADTGVASVEGRGGGGEVGCADGLEVVF